MDESYIKQPYPTCSERNCFLRLACVEYVFVSGAFAIDSDIRINGAAGTTGCHTFKRPIHTAGVADTGLGIFRESRPIPASPQPVGDMMPFSFSALLSNRKIILNSPVWTFAELVKPNRQGPKA